MSSIPREALKTNASNPGVIGVAELEAQCFGARYHFLRIGNIGRGDLVHHFGGRIAEHALGADIEYLNDALLVGGDTREVGAVENRVLQGHCYESLFAAGDVLVADGIQELARGDEARLDQRLSQLLGLRLHIPRTFLCAIGLGISLRLSLSGHQTGIPHIRFGHPRLLLIPQLTCLSIQRFCLNILLFDHSHLLPRPLEPATDSLLRHSISLRPSEPAEAHAPGRGGTVPTYPISCPHRAPGQNPSKQDV